MIWPARAASQGSAPVAPCSAMEWFVLAMRVCRPSGVNVQEKQRKRG
jgi:hypothetical protein